MRGLRSLFRVFVAAAVFSSLIIGVRLVESALGWGAFLSGLVTGVGVAVLTFVLLIQGANTRALALREGKRQSVLAQPPIPDEGTALYGWKVVRLDGSPFPFDHVVREVLFLNFWSTMCLPCVKELASIERLHRLVGPEGVVFMCVASDPDIARLRAWVAEHKVSLPVYALGTQDPPLVFDSDVVPATFIVASDARIVLKHEGAAGWDHPHVISLLRGLLAEQVVAAIDPPAAS